MSLAVSEHCGQLRPKGRAMGLCLLMAAAEEHTVWPSSENVTCHRAHLFTNRVPQRDGAAAEGVGRPGVPQDAHGERPLGRGRAALLAEASTCASKSRCLLSLRSAMSSAAATWATAQMHQLLSPSHLAVMPPWNSTDEPDRLRVYLIFNLWATN